MKLDPQFKILLLVDFSLLSKVKISVIHLRFFLRFEYEKYLKHATYFYYINIHSKTDW